MSQKIIYPGTFDPITLGHQDLIARAATLFNQVIVAVASHPQKMPLFDHQTRIELAKAVLSKLKNVTVLGYDGLLVDFAKKQKAACVLRGLRNVSDLAVELPLATMNRTMMPELETIFLAPGEKYLALSSSLVREIAQYGGDYSLFVDPIIAKKIAER